ncbi:MAG TPA: amino acid permease [Firmicutes bacterium]|nr:amino acid permease [Bacillota bacterium]
MGLWSKKSVETLRRDSAYHKSALKRNLGPTDLTALGIGAIIGTGIFVLTGVAAARYAGPAVLISFMISGTAAGLAALCYAELASMVPVAGSAYTYSYIALGEIIAWVIGWNLILEYAVSAGAVSIGWSGYFVNLLRAAGIHLPRWATASPLSGGVANLPAGIIALAITALLVFSTRESSHANKLIVAIKLAAVLFFIGIGIFHIKPSNWTPFAPYGWSGVMRGSAIVFFAYIGFDAVATAAEEVKRPQRDLPIGLIASLGISTILYILVTVILTGVVNYRRLDTPAPVAFALLQAGVPWGTAIVSVGALTGLTSVLLVTIFAQSRVFFAMPRDGLLPAAFTKIHRKFGTPYMVTIVTGIVVALIGMLLPIGMVAELANIGTLTAFVLVSIGILILRKTQPNLPRPFKTPFMPYTPILTIIFCGYLAANLPRLTWVRFVLWLIIGMFIYFLYGRNHSLAGKKKEGT